MPVRIAQPEFLAGPGLAMDAYEFAARAHADQRRKGDGSPYIDHPVEVARILHRDGGADDELLAAAFLHDVVEDTEIELDSIEGEFGPGVGRLVGAMTEDKEVEPYERRKDHHREQVEAAGERAARIYAADKLANLRDLRALYATVGEAAARRFKAPLDVRVALWRSDVDMAERLVPGSAIPGQLRSEIDAFDADRATTA